MTMLHNILLSYSYSYFCSQFKTTNCFTWKQSWCKTFQILIKSLQFKKENYRPVTVLPVLDNIYERLLVAELEDFYQVILSDFIRSYRRFYSCVVLLKLTDDWRAILDKGELVAVVSMDLSKAFDIIQHHLLLAKLKAYGVGERSFALFKDYLSGRQQRVKIADLFQVGRC